VTVAEWTLAGRYRVLERLGSGGTADVFRAHDEHLDRDVAIKVFRATPDDADALYGAARREAELQSLARLNHPNLIRLLDGAVGTDDPAYLVLDLVSGPDLASRLHEGALPEPEVRTIGRQIACALDYAHMQGMVHRDVKPANILLGSDGPGGTVWARLSDFGTVRMIDSARLTAADLTLGTASYIAPEQARGADVGPAADIYSLGLILIEALTGQRCFPGTTPESLVARLATAPSIPQGLPDDLSALLHAMTAMDPADRPTAAAVAESLLASVPPAVAAAADGETTTSLRAVVAAPLAASALAAPLAASAVDAEELPPPVVEPPGTHVSSRRRSKVLFALAAVAFAALVVGAAFLILGNTAPSEGDTPAGTIHGTQPSATATKHHPTPSHTAAGQVVAPPVSQSAQHSASQHPKPARHHNAVVVGPTSPAAQTSAVATTSAPAPVTSTTSAPAPTTSAPPATTSPAPTSSDMTTQAIAPSP
jgi:serine/threonine protein kinase